MKEILKKKKIIISVLLFLALIVGALVFLKSTSYAYKPLDLTDEELGIETEKEMEKEEEEVDLFFVHEEEADSKEIVNIALFGLDRRSTNEKSSRSDAIMVATIDFKHNKLKLTSLMRDQAVHIDGHGMDKLNHSYSYGQEELAIKTINQNFGLDIRDYATVDFFMLAEMIDAIGGVNLSIEENEIPFLNKNLRELSAGSKEILSPGEQTLTGPQAVAFSRIRSLGGGDVDRTERQRKVISAMVTKISSAGLVDLSKLWFKLSPHVETSLTLSDILKLGKEYLSNEMVWEQQVFPVAGDWKAGRLPNGGWIMDVDLEKQKQKVQDYLYLDHPL